MNSAKSLYKRIMVTFITLLLSILLIYILGILEFKGVAEVRERSLMLLSLTISLFILIFIVFYIRICKPIKFMEESVRRLKINSKENCIVDTTDFFDIVSNLNELMEEHEEQLLKAHSVEILNQKIHFSELQSQINPHFLYNTLEAIRGQAIEDKNYIITGMTEALAKYFRYSISNKDDIVKLKDELKNILNYIEIQRYRFEERINFELIVDENDEELLNSNIPKLTIQPIVENAIYHGLETKEGCGQLVIRVEKTQERVIIIITDDGVGIDCTTLKKLKRKIKGEESLLSKDEDRKGNGIALTNVNSRLKLLFGDEYGLNFASTVALGTEVEIVIPLSASNLGR